MRYGGYHIIAILVFIPLSIYFLKIEIGFKDFMNKTVYILTFVLIIFILRNTNRLLNEYEVYNYNPISSHKFNYDKKFYNRYIDIIEKNKSKYKTVIFFGKEFMITKIVTD